MPATIREILADKPLESCSETPDLDLQLILCHVIRRSRSYLFSHPDTQISRQQEAMLRDLLERRKRGEPVAYLTGIKGFWHIDCSVNSSVLIPRPETELLMEMALELEQDQVNTALELGTGSGAIAIALARERPAWTISATDISAAALSVARHNALANGASIELLEGSWYQPVPNRRFELIISNPPYIDPADPHLLAPSLKYEPVNALVADNKGLADLAQIITESNQHLNPGGWIILEHGYDQSAEVCDMLIQKGYESIDSRQDISGNDRAVIARKKTH